ncbi:MAG: GAF domain-containing protein [Chitinivibrionia bacterium]|nr:GAF domain-containing protein [Chitinivibrionia bacterium]
MVSKNKKKALAISGSSREFAERTLERSVWHNWSLLAATSLITTAGLAVAFPQVAKNRVSIAWPWPRTDLVLLAAVSLLMLALILYLTHKQQMLLKLRRDYCTLHAEARDRADRHCSRLIELFSVSHTMIAETDLQRVFDCITKTCAESFPCQGASLMLLDEKTNELVVRSTGSIAETDKPDIVGMRQKIGKGISGWVAEHRKPVLLVFPDDVKNYPGLHFTVRASLTASMVVPIIVRDEFVGILNVSASSPDIIYDESDLRVLQVFADNVGASIRHTEQTNWIRQAFLNRTAIPIR